VRACVMRSAARAEEASGDGYHDERSHKRVTLTHCPEFHLRPHARIMPDPAPGAPSRSAVLARVKLDPRTRPGSDDAFGFVLEI
jgi:hypothetical protein